jgi:acyl carrier protein
LTSITTPSKQPGKRIVLIRDDIVEIVQPTVAEVASVNESEVALDSLLLDDLGLEAEDFEDIVARLQSALDLHISPEELFPDDSSEYLTVLSLVHAIERKAGRD